MDSSASCSMDRAHLAAHLPAVDQAAHALQKTEAQKNLPKYSPNGTKRVSETTFPREGANQENAPYTAKPHHVLPNLSQRKYPGR